MLTIFYPLILMMVALCVYLWVMHITACMLKFYRKFKNTQLFSNALVKDNQVNKWVYKVLSKIPGTYLQYLLSFSAPQLSSPKEKAMTSHSSTLAWKIPWTEEPGGLQSIGSLRVRHDWVTSLSTFHFHALEKEMATHSCVLA